MSCIFKNVRLETGYQFIDGIVLKTNTELFHLIIKNGKFIEITQDEQKLASGDVQVIDCKGLLLLPSFRDMHIHIDKTYYGGSWKAPTIAPKGIFTRIEEEKEILPAQLPFAEERAKKLLDLFIQNGTTHIRTHCNIDPVIGLKNLDATMRAKEAYKNKVDIEIVAFPQHGLLRSDSVKLVREALKNGASIVGGVDPATVDEDIEKSLDTVMDLAVEANADIDLHIHDPGHLGLYTFKRLVNKVEEANWKNRVNISHAFGFAGVSGGEASEMAESFAKLGISITSSVPFGHTIPIPLLKEKGVNISLGDDSITDHWSPFGKGDSLEKAGILAERFNLKDEFSLSQTLQYITGGITPLNSQGERVWPQIGDVANCVLVEASCSAEVIARRSNRKATMFKGNLIKSSI